MASTYTIDASVWLNAFNPYEVGYGDSYRVLARLQAKTVPIIVPTLLLAEVAAAARTGCGDDDLSLRFTAALGRLPHLVWIPLDGTLARRAAELAARHGMRSNDAIYVAVAQRFGSGLITRERQQSLLADDILETWHPSDWLAQQGVAK